MPKIMDHTEYQKRLRSNSESSLRFIIKDAHEAIAAMPDGENVGYYTDEIHYASMELRRRAQVNTKRRYRNEQAI